MAAQNFPNPILRFTMVEEGGFSDNPDDPGGATENGITLTTYRKIMRNPSLTVADLKNITPTSEAAIYRAGYWSVMNGDALPGGVDLMVFDFGVNAGPMHSEVLLQRAAGLEGAAADGILGPISMAAIDKASPSELVAALVGLQLGYYRGLKTFSIFGAGWTARTERRSKASLQLVNTKGVTA